MKIGVAVSRSPAGPFHNIANQPIDYNPYDPDYHDVNLLMGPDQKKPPATLAEGETAPLGTYIPTIDPDVFFDSDGRTYLYFSRNAYRNWVWDTDLGKYIEESNIYAVEITNDWWNDPRGQTMPTIAPRYRGANAAPGGPSGPRRDGWTRILDYDHDKQAWENADVNDYAATGGEKKDRRWAEGSSTLRTSGPGGRPVYYLTYSANNWETPQYGVGYATASSPLGPFTKSPANPILSQNASIGMYSTGHGSFAVSPDSRELYYVHHGRPSLTEPQRRLYTERAVLRSGDARAEHRPGDERSADPVGGGAVFDGRLLALAVFEVGLVASAHVAGVERRRRRSGARQPAQPRPCDVGRSRGGFRVGLRWLRRDGRRARSGADDADADLPARARVGRVRGRLQRAPPGLRAGRGRRDALTRIELPLRTP